MEVERSGRSGALALGCALALIAACHDPEPVVDVTRVREGLPSPRLRVDEAERFYMGPAGAGEASSGPSEADVAALFQWEVPPGWDTLPPRQFRIINLSVGEAECYLTQVRGNQQLENLNRWRGQMGAEPLTQAQVDALPGAVLLGRAAHRMAVDGPYQGMGGTSWPDARMLAVYADFPGFALTVKMVGPREQVLAEEAAFDAFVASLAIDPAAMHGPDDGHDHGPGDGHDHGPDDGHDHGTGQSAPTASPGTPAGAGGLAWDVPAGWVDDGPRPMRHVTYTVEGRPTAECYVTLLPGDVGGELANLNRWLGQVGQPSISEAELRSLPRISLMGNQVALLEAYGATDGVLGTMVTLPDEVLFVKMVGPPEHLRAERANFIAFCASLRSSG